MIATFPIAQVSCVLLTVLPLGMAQPLYAQSITITPDGTGTIIQHQGNTYHIEGGTQAGGNLFHSFQEFGLSSGEIANFLSNPSVVNIFGRVTGGNASIIDGLIQATPNLYLMNPAGIVFGANASLNVGGDFFATTADRIGFEGGWFNATDANDYATLVDAPNQFAFLNGQPGAIVNTGNLTSNQGIHLTGGTVVTTGNINASTVTLAAVPGTQLVNLSQEGMLLSLDLPQDSVTAGITPVDLPTLLTGSGRGNPPVVAPNPTGVSTGALPLQGGDMVIAGTIQGQQVDLYAAGQVTPTDYDLVQGDTTVVRFPGADGKTTLSIIDAHADNAQALLFGGAPGTIATIIPDTENGIEAVSDTLSRITTPLDGIAITAEGNEGDFWLGNTWITHETVQNYQTQLAQWSIAFKESADLLLYSCFTALGATGEALMASLANSTGLDVAASTNATGSANHGGDWLLERSTGSIETQNPFTDEMLANWDGKLATFTVENGNDSGTDSLRDEITNANGSAGADEIRFANGVTLVDLTSGALSITEELMITGGSTNVTVQRNAGASDFRIFDVTGSATTTFDNVTIANGKTTDTGGGINSNGAVNLINTTVTGNSSTDRGGGIYTTNQAVTLTNSTVSGNSTNQYGGGVHTRSQITVSNSTVSNNSSRRNGGGLYSRSGNITLTDSTVSSNSSNRHGGGVWARSRTITLTNSTVTGNSTRLSAGGTYSQTIHLTDSVVSNNSSGDLGGGVYFTGTGTITDSTISGNSSASKGGGIYFRSNLTTTNSTVSNNISNRGGGIYSRGGGTATLTNTTISGNSSSDRGGGLFARGNGGGTITFLNSTIADNSSGNNGGGIFRNGGTVNITNSIVADNVASGSGNDLSGTFATIQSSLIEDIAGATITNNLNNITGIDPGLLPLANNGGPTQTHALSADSVAINAGDNTAASALTTDQRGRSRFIDGIVDLGAYEYNPNEWVSSTTTEETIDSTLLKDFDAPLEPLMAACATIPEVEIEGTDDDAEELEELERNGSVERDAHCRE